ncbi:aspartate/glutamate racemase family protein [Lichenibacterium minor]|uniref:Aspartate/glutamate racemase family protein n=1 Tax=Lichenibacterium minor TaxID=2316528 RepID=A0A4Q2U3G7_9HYPH|nr:aspartate/glutamate racemase family protein [Lichenibacterium minor]RYC30318.1 aspartate/glutamate racemase family protein [Lichenibacterium minor]
MVDILLINPNTSIRTTETMLVAARAASLPGSTIRGATAARGAGMILDEAALAVAAEEVFRVGRDESAGYDAVIVSAFGDPGVVRLRALLSIPVIGIGEAGLREAAAGSRRFGIATTTPGLVARMQASVHALGLDAGFTGLRVCAGSPTAHAADPAGQYAALARAVEDCMVHDGAERVVIGGGPLSASAARLRHRFAAAIVEPVPAAVRAVVRGLAAFPR